MQSTVAKGHLDNIQSPHVFVKITLNESNIHGVWLF